MYTYSETIRTVRQRLEDIEEEMASTNIFTEDFLRLEESRKNLLAKYGIMLEKEDYNNKQKREEIRLRASWSR